MYMEAKLDIIIGQLRQIIHIMDIRFSELPSSAVGFAGEFAAKGPQSDLMAAQQRSVAFGMSNRTSGMSNRTSGIGDLAQDLQDKIVLAGEREILLKSPGAPHIKQHHPHPYYAFLKERWGPHWHKPGSKTMLSTKPEPNPTPLRRAWEDAVQERWGTLLDPGVRPQPVSKPAQRGQVETPGMRYNDGTRGPPVRARPEEVAWMQSSRSYNQAKKSMAREVTDEFDEQLKQEWEDLPDKSRYDQQVLHERDMQAYLEPLQLLKELQSTKGAARKKSRRKKKTPKKK